MPNFTVKQIPESLYDRLKARAERHRRSINSEMIHILEGALLATPVDPNELLADARALRERANLPYLTDEALRQAREEGRA